MFEYKTQQLYQNKKLATYNEKANTDCALEVTLE